MDMGWFPDPTGRHELRYFNGQAWTGDVADGGHRGIDVLPIYSPVFGPGTMPRTTPGAGQVPGDDSNGPALVAMILGLVAVVCGLSMVLYFVAGLMGIVAFVLGAAARSRSADLPGRHGRGQATAGIVLGLAGIGLAAVGYVVVSTVLPDWLDHLTHRTVPAEHAITGDVCRVAEGLATYDATIENRSSEVAGFLVEVRFIGPTGDQAGFDSVRLVDLDPGSRTEVHLTRSVSVDQVTCELTVLDAP